MPNLLMLVVLVLVGLVLLAFLVGTVHLLISLRNAVPYVTAPPLALDQIIEKLALPDKGVLWDLGCGDARVLKAAHEAKPDLKLAGVDNNPMPLALAKINAGTAKLVQGDIMATDLKGVDRVFCYLGPGLMKALEPKFEQELPKGAKVVSMQFPLPNRSADEVVELKHGKPYAAKLYVYEY